MRSRTWTRTAVGICVLLLALGAVACSDDDTVDVDDVGTAVGRAGGSETEFCSDLDDLDVAVGDFRTLSASSTVDDAKDAGESVQDALDNLKESAEDAHEARVDAIETAYESLKDSIDVLPGSETLATSLASITGQISSLGAALEGLQSQSGCP